jgi:hypothetical protein
MIIVLLVAGFLLRRFGVEWGSWLSLLGGMLAGLGESVCVTLELALGEHDEPNPANASCIAG